MEIDETDRKVLDALTADGRASDRDIAAETGIVANRVADRRAAMEETGVIDGYVSRIDYEKLGYDVTAVFQLSVEGDGVTGVVDRLRERHTLLSVYEVTGSYDVIAIGRFPGTTEMNRLIKDLMTDPAVRSVNTGVVLDVVKENSPIRLDG